MITTGIDALFHDVTVIVNGRTVQAVEFRGAYFLPNGQPLHNARPAS